MRVKRSTIDSNVRIAKAKVAVLDTLDNLPETEGLTQAEWEVVLAELAQDAARYRLRAERGSEVEDED